MQRAERFTQTIRRRHSEKPQLMDQEKQRSRETGDLKGGWKSGLDKRISLWGKAD